MRLVTTAARAAYKHELFPPRVLWWLAARGMRDFFHVVRTGLEPHLGAEATPTMAALGARMFERRYDALRERAPWLLDRAARPRDVALAMAALYRVETAPKAAWTFEGLGGAPRGVERLRAQALVRPMPPRARWEEVTTHLGELLVVLTEHLPERLPHARKILGDLFHAMGERFAKATIRAFGLPRDPTRLDDPAELAIEVLRMSEYVFRVNPEHWSGTTPSEGKGYLAGNACPWYARPGWNGGHCGIFGQFQSGISSVFGLRYRLTTTIPKHGGNVCKVDLAPAKPIELRKKPAPN